MKNILFIIFMSFNSLVFSDTYHVATDGSGDYTTIAQVNAATFSPDDFILFNKGDTWRETLLVPSSGTLGHPITFGSYGTGSNPIITGFNLITVGWVDSGGNVWEAPVTTQPTNVYFDGVRGTLVANKVAIDAEYKWFWEANILYVWSPPDSDPSAYYVSPGIEARTRSISIDTNDKSYITIDGLTLRENLWLGWNKTIGIIVKNSTIEWGREHGIFIAGHTTASDFLIDTCIVRDNGGMGIYIDSIFTSGMISNSQIYDNGRDSLVDSKNYHGIYGYLGNISIYSNTIYGNCPGTAYLTGSSHGIYSVASSLVTNIYLNTIYGQPNGDGIYVRGSANIYRNKIYSNSRQGISTGGNGIYNVIYDIYNNDIYGNGTGVAGGSGISGGGLDTGTISLIIDNNTLYQNSGTLKREIEVSDDLTTLTIKNNILYSTDTRGTVYLVTQTGVLDVDYNCHWRADGNPSFRYGSDYPTWAEWQALGFDTHGINSDPLFVSETNYHLQKTSPCIDTGISLSNVIDDYDGVPRPVGSGYDIGTYEWYNTWLKNGVINNATIQ